MDEPPLDETPLVSKWWAKWLLPMAEWSRARMRVLVVGVSMMVNRFEY